jgi:hypothetical protein
MRRLLLALLIFASLSPATVLAQSSQTSGMAPADRYFGRMRMSILGIRNTLADAGTKLDVDQASRSAVFHKVVLADEALHDWAAQYPRDPWIPRYIYALAQLYRRLPGDEARTFMNDTIGWLCESYPSSNEAHLATDFSR